MDDLVQKIGELKVTNKGTGAGGSNTNKNGKTFEEVVNNESRLLADGFNKRILKENNKYGYVLYKKIDENTSITYVKQSGFKTYVSQLLNIQENSIYRHPDEAYIIESSDGKITIKIIEVKNQNGSGSVDTKLLAAPMFVEEYKLMLSDWDIEIEYIFCLNNYFKKQFDDETNRYYQNLKIILKKYNIKYLFGEASDYFENIDLIIFNK